MKKILVLLALIGLFLIPPVGAEPRFIDDGKGIVTDIQSGLMWDTNLAAEKSSIRDLFSWQEKDRKGWRFPVDKEIKTLYDIDIKNSPFVKMKPGYYWSIGPALVGREMARGFGCFGFEGQERHSNGLYYLMPVREVGK